MRIGPNTTVTMDYTLRLDSGEVLDSSEGQEPLTFDFGRSEMIPGLERELMGLQRGDTREIRVAAKDAYGERRREAVQEVPLERFPAGVIPTVGLRLGLKNPEGQDIPFIVTGVSEGHATLDFNHPLAGESLTFAIRVVNVQVSGNGRIVRP